MLKLSLKEMLEIYNNLLLNDIIPWWDRHGLDREYGGFLTCMKEDGTMVSDDKYMWSQGRGLWIYSYIYNNFDRDERHLEFINKTRNFLVDHGRTENGDWVNHLSRTGEQLEGPTSIYSDIFIAYGLIEHFRATGNSESLDIARKTARRVAQRIHNPNFTDVAPFKLKPGYKLQGPLFINLNMLTPLLMEIDDPELEDEAERCVRVIIERHMDDNRKVNIEMLTPDYNVTDFAQGRDYCPGHGIECAWIFMHEAQRKKDDELMENALKILRWHLEKGWDEEYGGIVWWRNIDGEEPWEKNWASKLWWPHTESFIALSLAYEKTGEQYYMDWWMKMHEYAFRTFPDPVNGEWIQKTNRQGKPITLTLVLPVKDPFHLPRGVMFAIESIKRQIGQ